MGSRCVCSVWWKIYLTGLLVILPPVCKWWGDKEVYSKIFSVAKKHHRRNNLVSPQSEACCWQQWVQYHRRLASVNDWIHHTKDTRPTLLMKAIENILLEKKPFIMSSKKQLSISLKIQLVILRCQTELLIPSSYSEFTFLKPFLTIVNCQNCFSLFFFIVFLIFSSKKYLDTQIYRCVLIFFSIYR